MNERPKLAAVALSRMDGGVHQSCRCAIVVYFAFTDYERGLYPGEHSCGLGEYTDGICAQHLCWRPSPRPSALILAYPLGLHASPACEPARQQHDA